MMQHQLQQLQQQLEVLQAGHGQGFPGDALPSGGRGGALPGQGLHHGRQGQGLPGYGLPGQGHPGSVLPGQGLPGQGLPGQGFPGLALPGRLLPGQDHGQVYVPAQASSEDGSQVSRVVSLDNLYAATIKNAQYRASDFAKIGNFSYSSQIKPNNINLALFSYGSLRHLLALTGGTLPQISKEEFISRLHHLINVLEITCLSSNMTDYDLYSWKISREYNNKVLRDVEFGLKHWDTLPKTIDSLSWTYAKEVTPKPKMASQPKPNNNSNQSQKLCTTWNTFRKEGCSYENSNPGESCIYLHFCSRCRSKGLNRKHKLWQCTEPEPIKTSTPTSSVATVTSA